MKNIKIRNLIYQASPNLRRNFLKKSEWRGGGDGGNLY